VASAALVGVVAASAHTSLSASLRLPFSTAYTATALAGMARDLACAARLVAWKEENQTSGTPSVTSISPPVILLSLPVLLAALYGLLRISPLVSLDVAACAYNAAGGGFGLCCQQTFFSLLYCCTTFCSTFSRTNSTSHCHVPAVSLLACATRSGLYCCCAWSRPLLSLTLPSCSRKNILATVCDAG